MPVNYVVWITELFFTEAVVIVVVIEQRFTDEVLSGMHISCLRGFSRRKCNAERGLSRPKIRNPH
jgi:hypothetical protein